MLMSKRRKNHSPNKLGTWEYVEPSFSHGSVRNSKTVNSGKTVQNMFSLELQTALNERNELAAILYKGVLTMTTVTLFHVQNIGIACG